MGPMFWHEVRHLCRRRWFLWLRLLALVFAAALWLYLQWAIQDRAAQEASFALMLGGRLYYGAEQTPVSTARLVSITTQVAQEFLFVFIAAAAVLVLVFAPITVIGGLAEDRRRGTLDLLLTTGLSPWEIVVGKVLPRVMLLGLLLAGMMVMTSLVQFLGGIDMNVVFASLLVLAGLLLAQAALSTWLLARGSSPSGVLILSYVLLTGWLVLGTVHERLPWPADEALPWFNAAALLNFLNTHFARRGSLGDWPWQLAGVHTLVHVVLAGLGLWLASRALRRGNERAATLTGRGWRRWFRRRRPPFNEDRPLLWKEKGSVSRWRWLFWLFLAGCLWAGFSLEIWLDYPEIRYSRGYYQFIYDLPRHLLIIGHAALVVPVVLVASRAAWCLRSEADRATWDTLLATPTKLRDILRAKWWASFLAALPALAALSLAQVGVMALALVLMTRLENMVALEWSQRAWVVGLVPALNVAMTALATSLGLLMSVACRSAFQAWVATFLALLSFYGLPMLVAFFWPKGSDSAIFIFIDAVEWSVWMGLPLILLLSASIFLTRLRRWVEAAWRLVAMPLILGLTLQLPLVLFPLGMLLYEDLPSSVPSVALGSPLGFLIAAIERAASRYRTTSITDALAVTLLMYAALSWTLWLAAAGMAARRSDRLGDRVRSRRHGSGLVS